MHFEIYNEKYRTLMLYPDFLDSATAVVSVEEGNTNWVYASCQGLKNA